MWHFLGRLGGTMLIAAALGACGGGAAAGGSPPAAVGAPPTPVSAPPTASPLPSPTGTAAIIVDAANGGPAIAEDLLGVSLATWFDDTQTFVEQALASTGIRMVRWPGGSESDTYHWATNTLCGGGGYIATNSTFDNFIADDVKPLGVDVAVTLNYGSNAACNAGGDPSEAAAWVSHAKSNNDNVRYWTVGNEVFGSWEYDLHSPKNDAATYANAVATGYYPAIKAADPNAQVGVVVAGSYSPAWDQTVLQNAKYDFVELHYYPQAPGTESDAYLLGNGVSDFTNALTSLRNEMNAFGVSASTPIYIGEINSVYSSPGKQTVSIVEGLWAGMVVAEMMKQPGVTMATWWESFGGCSTGNNNSSALYGFQNFGDYNLFSDGFPSNGCGSPMTAGTPFPDGRAYYLLSQFAPPGSTMRNLTLASSVQNVRAYADKTPTGYALLLFNLSETATATLPVQLVNAASTSFSATQQTYGKAQYDQSQNNLWPSPTTQALGTVGTTLNVTLPPWSINVITLH